MSKEELGKLLIDEIDEQEDIEIEMNMLRERAKKADTVTDKMWSQVRQEHRDLVEEYLDINTHLSPRTKTQYKSGLRHFFYWVYEVLNDKSISEISKRDFMRYMSFMQNRGLSSSGMGFKKSAVSAFNIYIENIVAEDDPDNYGTFKNFTRGLQPIPKNQVYSKEAITYDEYQLILNTLEEDGNYLGMAWVAAAFNTGARRAEINQFKTEILDYKFPKGQNYIMSHTVMAKGGGGGKPVEYMVNKEVLKYWKLWIDKRGYNHEYIFTVPYKGEYKVISDSWANYFCTDVLSDILGRRINPHIWKSSAITHLLEQGVSMKVVSEYVAQHNDMSTTQNFYDLRSFEEEKGQIFSYLDKKDESEIKEQ